MSRTPLLTLTATALAVLSLGLVACGSDKASSDAAAPPTDTAPAATAPATTLAPPVTAPAATAPAATTATEVDVEADPNGSLAFTQKSLTAPAGPVILKLTNPSVVPHNIALEGNGVESDVSDTIEGGASAEITVDLPAGTYTYFCNIPGHRAAGMEGTLTVK